VIRDRLQVNAQHESSGQGDWKWLPRMQQA
jgi:hypothetical protein